MSDAPTKQQQLAHVHGLQQLSAEIRAAEAAYQKASAAETAAIRAYDDERARLDRHPRSRGAPVSQATMDAVDAAVLQREAAWATYKALLDQAEAQMAKTPSGRECLAEVEQSPGAQLLRIAKGQRL